MRITMHMSDLHPADTQLCVFFGKIQPRSPEVDVPLGNNLATFVSFDWDILAEVSFEGSAHHTHEHADFLEFGHLVALFLSSPPDMQHVLAL